MNRSEVVKRLATAGVPSPESDAHWLMDAFEDEALVEAVTRREAREPLQLILGTAVFRYVELAVEPGVFIPRPETEVLAGEIIERIAPGATVIEPCTGTGAVACAVASEADPARVIATDISDRAVALATRNAVPWPTVSVLHARLFAGIDTELQGRVDAIVCNPPYLTPEQVADAEPEVRDHDPHDALVGGESGWEVIADLIAAAPYWLRPGGWIAIEDDPARTNDTAAALSAVVGPATIVNDLAGRPRVIVARHVR